MTPLALTILAGLEFLGPARAFSHSSSASRDTAALGMVVAPHRVLSGGGDFALVSFDGAGIRWRVGTFAMLELESEGETDEVAPFPQADIQYWRGIWGYSIAAAWPRLEAALSFRHESEHQTASNDGGESEDVSDVPHIGDFVMADVASRRTFGDVEVTARAQHKLFLPDHSGYTHGPGADVIVRWRRFARVHPFNSTFAEYLFGADAYPDAYLVRNLTGVVLPSPHGDTYVFLDASVGHRKGLAVFTEEATLGFGLRFAFF